MLRFIFQNNQQTILNQLVDRCKPFSNIEQQNQKGYIFVSFSYKNQGGSCVSVVFHPAFGFFSQKQEKQIIFLNVNLLHQFTLVLILRRKNIFLSLNFNFELLNLHFNTHIYYLYNTYWTKRLQLFRKYQLNVQFLSLSYKLCKPSQIKIDFWSNTERQGMT